MEAANILHDSEASAEFFQFYSKSFAGGMFIEIVQRSPGYIGFGASNAPFRIAAQKRFTRPKGMPKA
ncbi:hypothetical protein [Fulvimarina sp. MAC8]|uniref:hypothetical protein n=1 Tax=Fulvimarina sp. MAC8 TaxID=3162874 RepID=UPI0032ECF608